MLSLPILMGILLSAPAGLTTLPPQLRPARAAAAQFHSTGQPALLSQLAVPTRGADLRARAQWFAERYGAPLGWARELDFAADTARLGSQRVRVSQRHNGLPVLDRSAVLSFDSEGQLRSLSGDLRALRHVAPARIEAEAAIRLAQRAALGEAADGGAQGAFIEKATARPVVLARGDEGVMGFEVRLALWVVRVDAAQGEVISVTQGFTR